MRKKLTTLLILSASLVLIGTGCSPGDRMPEGVDLQLENVVYLEWEDLDGSRRYFVELDGEKLLSTGLRSAYVQHEGPIDALVVRATEAGDRRGDPAEDVTVLAAERRERLVVDWDPEHYERPYIGMRAGGLRQSYLMEDRPHIITIDPDDLKLLVLGEEVDRPDAIVNSPFEVTRQSVREFGPYVELPLP